MEIKLNVGDRINIPENCQARIEDNIIIIEEKKEEFKDGDILTHTDYKNYPCPFIYKGTDERGYHLFYVGIDYTNEIFLPGEEYDTWGNDKLRHATEEEKQLLFDKMKEQGLRWNAETKSMEEIRSRVNYRYLYLNVNSTGEVVETHELCSNVDNKRWELGNYYLPEEREQAEEDAAKVRAIFQERLNKTK
jgi:hypothetical protein